MIILFTTEDVCSHEKGDSTSSLRGMRVPARKAFPHSRRAKIGARAKKYNYIDDQPLKIRKLFSLSLSNAGKAVFVKEAENACYEYIGEGDSGRATAQRNPSVVRCCKIVLEAARPSG